MAERLPFSSEQYWDATNRNAFNGALMYTYEANTTTPKETYTDESEGAPLTNPIEADANGIFPEIYGIGSYFIVIRNNDDSETILDADDIEGGGSGGGSGDSSATYQSMTGDDGALNQTGDVGTIVETGEYIRGSGKGGAKYIITDINPNMGALSPQKNDGNYLKFLIEDDYVTSDQIGLNNSTAPTNVVSTLNQTYPVLESFGLSLSLTERLNINDTVIVLVRTYSNERGEGGIVVSAPSVQTITSLRLSSNGATLENIYWAVTTGEWDRGLTIDNSYCKVLNCIIDFNSTIPDLDPGNFNTSVAFIIFSAQTSGFTEGVEVSGNDITGTCTAKLGGLLIANCHESRFRDNIIHDVTATNNSGFHWAIYLTNDCPNSHMIGNVARDCKLSGFKVSPDVVSFDPDDHGRVTKDNYAENLDFQIMAHQGANKAYSENNTGVNCGFGMLWLTGSTNCISVGDKVVNPANASGADKPCFQISDSPNCKLISPILRNDTLANVNNAVIFIRSPGGSVIDPDANPEVSSDFLHSNFVTFRDSDECTLSGGRVFGENGNGVFIDVDSNLCVVDGLWGFGSTVLGSTRGVRNAGTNTRISNCKFVGYDYSISNDATADYTTIQSNEFTNGVVQPNIQVLLDAGTNTASRGNIGLADSGDEVLTATTAELNDKTSDANTIGKREGKEVYDSVINRPVYASAATDTSPWRFSDGVISNTPV